MIPASILLIILFFAIVISNVTMWIQFGTFKNKTIKAMEDRIVGLENEKAARDRDAAVALQRELAELRAAAARAGSVSTK